MALAAATPHLTQFPGDIDHISKLSDAQLEKLMNDPNSAWWSEPMALIFGKAAIPTTATADVFANTQPGAVPLFAPAINEQATKLPQKDSISLGGPWGFYDLFRMDHGLTDIPVAPQPEIGINTGTALCIPIIAHQANGTASTISLKLEAPAGWKVTSGQEEFSLPAEISTALRVEVKTPLLSPEEVKSAKPQEIVVHAEKNGAPIGGVKLRVQLLGSALPQ